MLEGLFKIGAGSATDMVGPERLEEKQGGGTGSGATPVGPEEEKGIEGGSVGSGTAGGGPELGRTALGRGGSAPGFAVAGLVQVLGNESETPTGVGRIASH